MLQIILVFLSVFLMGSFFFLLGFNIYKKTRTEGISGETDKNYILVKNKINELLNGSDEEFQGGLEDFSRSIMAPTKAAKKTRKRIDRLLLKKLENPEGADESDHLQVVRRGSPPGKQSRVRLIEISRKLNFHSDCLDQIKSKQPWLIALGSRRAGLYQVTEASAEMISVLDILSSENQFEILMGLARMGSADLMKKAFEKIQKSVIINERAVTGILSVFPGGKEKKQLFRSMIQNETDFLAAQFLKAADQEMVQFLKNDISVLLLKGGKEVRIASIHALGKLKENAPMKELIQAMEDEDWEVRAMAAKALAHIKKHDASIALFKALNDQQWWVRQNAANALTSHHGYEDLFMLAVEMGDEYSRDSIISAIENVCNPLLLRSIKVMAV